jgi:Zn-dependent protease with chaperone function
MAATVRALRAFLLLAGFYLMGVLLLALIVGVDVLMVYEMVHGEFRLGELYVLAVSLMVTLPILDGMFILGRRRSGGGSDGYEVARDAQPRLWAEIEEAARLAGTRAPDRVLLTGDVNASVSERTRLLGLVRGRRSLSLGVPLLAGLTVPRLRAVLAHEFGHYSHHDTRLIGPTMRGRVSILHTIEQFRLGAKDNGRTFAIVGNLYVRYGRMYMRASQSVARRQELAADRRAALTVGRASTANALREVPLLEAAFEFYVDRYATIGWDAELLPAAGEFYGGFGRLLAEPGRAEELAALREGLTPTGPDAGDGAGPGASGTGAGDGAGAGAGDGAGAGAGAGADPRAGGGAGHVEPSPYDSHPPMAERVRLIEALPDDGVVDDPGAPAALTLLEGAGAPNEAGEAGAGGSAGAGPSAGIGSSAGIGASAVATPVRATPAVLAEVEAVTLTEKAAAMRRLPWDELAQSAGWSAATSAAEPLRRALFAVRPGAGGNLPTLAETLDAVDEGLLWTRIAPGMPVSRAAQQATGRAAREFARTGMLQGLDALVHLALAHGGRARWTLSWTGAPLRFALPSDVTAPALETALTAAVADVPDTAPLRALLAPVLPAPAAPPAPAG